MSSRDFLTYNERSLSASCLRTGLSNVLRCVEHDHIRMLITRHDRPVAVLCPMPDLEMIREWHRKSVREKELELEMTIESWNRARREGRNYDSVLHT